MKYPLKFRKLSLAIPEKVLYLTRYEAVAKPEIAVSDLMVTYVPPEEAFVGE